MNLRYGVHVACVFLNLFRLHRTEQNFLLISCSKSKYNDCPLVTMLYCSNNMAPSVSQKGHATLNKQVVILLIYCDPLYHDCIHNTLWLI